MTRDPRPAERVGDVFVITEARWPTREPSAFAFDKYAFQARLRAEAAVFRPTSLVIVTGL